MRYLDFNGLQRYDTKIKDKIDDIDNTIVLNTVKNLVYPNVLTTSTDNTFIPPGSWDNAYICNIPAGEYVLSTYITTSESTIPSGRIAQLQVQYADNTTENITPRVAIEKDATKAITISFSKTVMKWRFYTTFAPIEFSNFMICSANLYKLNNTFTPYTQTNAEITSFISNPITTQQIDDLWTT